jgi:hypothetical protein
MNVRDSVWYIVIAAIYLAILMLLVRPSSKGPQIVGQLLDALGDLLKGTTGFGTQSS